MSFSGKKMTCDLILAKTTLFGFLLLFFRRKSYDHYTMQRKKPKYFPNGHQYYPKWRATLSPNILGTGLFLSPFKEKNTQDKSFFDSVAALHSPYSVRTR
jgi:hypothetical protein